MPDDATVHRPQAHTLTHASTQVHTQTVATTERSGEKTTRRDGLGPEREIQEGPKPRTWNPTGIDSTPYPAL